MTHSFPTRRSSDLAEARTERTLGHANYGLPDVLVGQLVEGDEHQRARFARGRRGLDQQVLLAALLIGLRLHPAHAQLVGLSRRARLRGLDGNRGTDFSVGAQLKSALCVPDRVT